MNNALALGGPRLNLSESGCPEGPPLVLAHGLGMDGRIWDPVLPLLPKGLCVIRYDMRGHGGSDCPAPPYAMGALVRDAEALLEARRLRDVVFLGLGLGGMVAQGLAIKRLDLVRALILVNTATRSGPAEIWQGKADTARAAGMAALAQDILSQWGPCGGPDAARAMLLDQPAEGYAGCCAAIAGTDFYTPTSGLRLPTLGLAGSADRAIPPDMTRETISLIPGARFHLIRRAGHLSCLDQPAAFAAAVREFLESIGHV